LLYLCRGCFAVLSFLFFGRWWWSDHVSALRTSFIFESFHDGSQRRKEQFGGCWWWFGKCDHFLCISISHVTLGGQFTRIIFSFSGFHLPNWDDFLCLPITHLPRGGDPKVRSTFGQLQGMSLYEVAPLSLDLLQFTSLYFTSLCFILLYFHSLYFTLLYFTFIRFTLLYLTLLCFALLCFIVAGSCGDGRIECRRW
jgi:hypothetical protein